MKAPKHLSSELTVFVKLPLTGIAPLSPARPPCGHTCNYTDTSLLQQRWFRVSNSSAVQECSCKGPVKRGWKRPPSAPPPGRRSPAWPPLPPSCHWWCTVEEEGSFRSELIVQATGCFSDYLIDLGFPYGNVSGLQQQSRDMSGGQSFTNGPFDLCYQIWRESLSGRHL